MDFESAKKWLELNISIRKQLIETEDLNQQISLCRVNKENTLHVFKGIEILADLLGLELFQDKSWQDEGDFQYLYYFMYDGFKVFQLSKERLVQYAGTY